MSDGPMSSSSSSSSTKRSAAEGNFSSSNADKPKTQISVKSAVDSPQLISSAINSRIIFGEKPVLRSVRSAAR